MLTFESTFTESRLKSLCVPPSSAYKAQGEGEGWRDEKWAGAAPPSVAEEMVSFRKNRSGHLGTNFLMNKALKPKEKQSQHTCKRFEKMRLPLRTLVLNLAFCFRIPNRYPLGACTYKVYCV